MGQVIKLLICSDVVMLILLLISREGISQLLHEIFVKPEYYYMEDGESFRTKNFSKIAGKNMNKLVIDLLMHHFINYIYITYTTEATSKRVLLYKYVNVIEECEPFIISGKEQRYACNRFGRIIVIDNKWGGIDKLNILGYETRAEYFIGCFKNRNPEKPSSMSLLVECSVKCRKSFYFGYNMEEHCLCITTLTSLVQVDLVHCNVTCGIRYQFCGKGNVFGVYSQKIFQKNMYLMNPTWKCIYEQNECSLCPEGRKGYKCETIDCSLNNGNCGHMQCREKNVFDIEATQSICECKDGFMMDNIINCIDIDECSMGANPCKEFLKKYCLNTPGSYQCTCGPGYTETSSGTCTDIDECIDDKLCLFKKFCFNTFGGYKCKCGPGYVSLEDKACIESSFTTLWHWGDESKTRKKYFLLYMLLVFITLSMITSFLYYKKRRL